MMCTPLHSQSGLWRSIGFWVRSCGSTAAFGSMPVRPRSGTGVAMSPVGTKPPLNEFRAINPHAKVWFGGSDLPQEKKVLGTPFGKADWMPPRPLTSSCFSESQRSKTCNRHGLSCCSALYHERHYIYGYFILTTPKHSHDRITFTLGSVSPRCWGNGMTLSHQIGAVFFPLGLRSAHRSARAAFWGSWADCLQTISQRHGHISQTLLDALESLPASAVHIPSTGASRRDGP